ncbi:MAG: carbonic anhydrase [Acidobacteria bacterium]|nr:carbonic anhydrase [Acidobacteriota bacterium]
MDKLIAGYQRFRKADWPEQQRIFESLAAKGQSPLALVVGCIDSRVDPARIFDTTPGEILALRNVANLVPPYAPDAAYHGTSAALEFAVCALKVPNIIVLGHGLCAGVRALLVDESTGVDEFVEPWMKIADRARARVANIAGQQQRQHACEHEVIKVSLENLLTFPWIAERVDGGSLRLHGAWFEIRTGVLHWLQPDGTFTEVEPTL